MKCSRLTLVVKPWLEVYKSGPSAKVPVRICPFPSMIMPFFVICGRPAERVISEPKAMISPSSCWPKAARSSASLFIVDFLMNEARTILWESMTTVSEALLPFDVPFSVQEPNSQGSWLVAVSVTAVSAA